MPTTDPSPPAGPLRLGTGAGFAGDRVPPAIDLVERGDISHLIFECLGERTVALAQLAKRSDSALGYGQRLQERMEAVLPACVQHGTTIISNIGAANPHAAADETRAIARDLGLGDLTVAAITGDDVRERILGTDARVWETGQPVAELGADLLSANAYIGVEAILPALRAGADVILGGRIADPSLFLAAMIHRFGWALDDWDRLGAGTVVAHLMECGAQVTGGYFADPGRKDVPGLTDVGFPIAEVHPDGSAIISKTPGSGGVVSEQTCKEQLLYEIGDPGGYLTPDVTADLTQVTLTQVGPDRVEVRGARGRARPDRLKVTLGVEQGYLGEGQISYAGAGAADRATLAGQLVRDRLAALGVDPGDLRIERIGVDAVLQGFIPEPSDPGHDVRLRVAGRAATRRDAARIGEEVEALYLNGPAGGGGATTSVRPVIAAYSTLIDRSLVDIRTDIDGERV